MTATMPAITLAVTGLGSRIVSLRGVEDPGVDDERGGADDRELDQLMMPLGERPDRAGQPGDRGISEGHGSVLRKRPGVCVVLLVTALNRDRSGMTPLLPVAGGPVVAMVGGGQLARMTHQAAIALGPCGCSPSVPTTRPPR